MVAAAVIGSAVVGGVVSSSASKSAANAQTNAANTASATSQAQYDQTRQDQLAAAAQARTDNAPYLQAGYGALSQLVSGTQAGGSLVAPFTMADYQEDPGYQFRLSQGQTGINNAATAAGSRYSGATLKALARFNSDQASQEYSNAYSRYNTDQTNTYNRLAGLSGTGQTAVANTTAANTAATNATTAAGTANAATQGTAAANAAAATASGYVGTANAVNGTLGTLTNAYQQNAYLNSLSGYGSSGVTEGATNTTAAQNYYGTGYSP